jgi:hypothetical protein
VTFKDLQKIIVQSQSNPEQTRLFERLRSKTIGYGAKMNIRKKTSKPKETVASIT